MCLVSHLLLCQTSYTKIQRLPFSITYLLAVRHLEGNLKCSIQRFLCPYTYVSCTKLESLLASEDLSVAQATRVHNYLQMQVMAIIKLKLINPVQSLISFCGAHISAGILYRLICDQLKDPVCPPCCQGQTGDKQLFASWCSLLQQVQTFCLFNDFFKKQFIN